MAGIPAGMEDFDSEDDDMLVYNIDVGTTSSKTELNEENKPYSKKAHENPCPKPLTSIKENATTFNRDDKSRSYQHHSTSSTGTRWRGFVSSKDPLVSRALEDLRVAVMRGKLESVQSVISQGINPDRPLKSGWTALMYACHNAYPDIVHFLLQSHANANLAEELFTPLMAACSSREENEGNLLSCVELLLHHGAVVNASDRYRMTALMFACREGRCDIIKKLLEGGANVNVQDTRGWTSLSWAASGGHGLAVKHLLEAKADPTLMSISGETAAELALSQGYDNVAHVLQKVSGPGNELEAGDKEKLTTSVRKAPTCNSLPSSMGSYIKHGDLEMFLSGLSLSYLIPSFHDHNVTFADLLQLTGADLEKLGVDKVGDRKRILEGIESVHKKKWEKSSLPDAKNKKHLNCPEVVAIMSNIGNHLKYIQSTVLYLRQQLQSHPQILEFGQEACNVHGLILETEVCIKSNIALQNDIVAFNAYLEKVQDHVQYNPGDMITSTPKPAESFWLRRISMFGIIVGVVCYTLWKRPPLLLKMISAVRRDP